MKNLLNDLFELSNFKLRANKIEYHRTIFDEIFKSDSSFIGIYGSRGVGKTTIMMQLAKKLDYNADEILYISCDHPMLSGVSLFELVEYFSKYGGKVIFIDEVHEALNYEKELKSISDFLDIKLFFSGSSAIKLTNPSFTRRFAMFHLPILSFREYLELSLKVALPSFSFEKVVTNHTKIANSILETLKEEKILRNFSEYLKVGAYPFYFSNKQNYNQMLLDTVNTILYTDLSSIYNLSGEKVVVLKKLLSSICVSDPLELSIESLSKRVGVSKATLYKYIEYLHRAELLRHITYEGKRFKSMQKPDKLYLSNPTLFHTLCLKPKVGTLRESFFASQVSFNSSLYYVEKGDFLVDESYTVEIGGKNKGFERPSKATTPQDKVRGQLKDIKNSFVVADDIEVGFKNKIPLWIFGFLY